MFPFNTVNGVKGYISVIKIVKYKKGYISVIKILLKK